MNWNVFYDTPNGVESYLAFNVSYEMAQVYLSRFKERYFNGNKPKPYPNGKGFYPFSNPRVEIAIMID